MVTSIMVNSKVSTQGLSEPFPREKQVIHGQQQHYLREIWPHMLEGWSVYGMQLWVHASGQKGSERWMLSSFLRLVCG